MGVEVDGRELLDKLASLPVSTWRYEWEPEGVVHVGPMAQDFAALFSLGDSDTAIATVDYCGVLLVAVQALHRRVLELEARLDGREAEDVCGGVARADSGASHDHIGGH